MRRAWLASLVILTLLASRGSTSAASNTAVSFSPPSANATVGATIPIDVVVANVGVTPGLAAYDLTLHFDPSIVRVETFVDSGFASSGQNVVICVTGKIDNAGGTASATCTAIPLFGAPGVSTVAPVALLHVSLAGLAPGTSPLSISGALSGPTGTAIPASFQDGTVTVNSATAVEPTVKPGASATSAPTVSPSPLVTARATTVVAPTETRASVTSPTATAGPIQIPATGDGPSANRGLASWVIILLAATVTLGLVAWVFLRWRLRWKSLR